MNIAHEDTKLHDDGIFGSYMGYKEWFHYEGTFFVGKKLLTFVLGFPRSHPGTGALGWISFDNNQYSLAGNPEDGTYDKFFNLETRADIQPDPSGQKYTITYKDLESGTYTGNITGEWPRNSTTPTYIININTPEIDELTIALKLNSLDSVFTREIPQYTICNKQITSWFHSGDITASLKGTIQGEDITSITEKNRGWYERMWAKIPVFWPSEWLWFMAHLDYGGVLDLYVAKTLGMRVHALDECWVYEREIFNQFSDYWIHFPEKLEEAVEKRDYSKILGECITCGGRNKGNSFLLKAYITDFRQYEFCSYYADIKWTNFIFETEGTAIIGSKTIDLKGQGVAERAPMNYWWL